MNVFSEKVKNFCIIYLRKLTCLNIITTAMFYVALWVLWNELNCIGNLSVKLLDDSRSILKYVTNMRMLSFSSLIAWSKFTICGNMEIAQVEIEEACSGVRGDY